MQAPPAPLKDHQQVYDHASNTWTHKRKYNEVECPPAPMKGKRQYYDHKSNTW
jgi:hypothetical protein